MSDPVCSSTLNYYNNGSCFPFFENLYYGMATCSSSRMCNLIESFGCHLSWCELRTIAICKQTLIREEKILAIETWDYNDRPTYYTAIRNLQGFIAYHLNKYEDALSFFQDVLEKDTNNINALGNVMFLHGILCETDKQKRYNDRLIHVLEGVSYEERARAYADKAHAIRYFEQFKRCFRYMKYIERAVAIGEKCNGPTRAEWFFDYALALYRRDMQMIYLKKLRAKSCDIQLNADDCECYSDDKINKGFLKACQMFLQVARISSSKDYQALSWVFIGILINHDNANRSMAVAFPNEKSLHRMTAIDCYERGAAINPENSIVLRRVGSEYVKLKLFEPAKKYLTGALQMDQSRFLYRYCADMYLGMYECANPEVQSKQGRDWLETATRYFTKAIEKKKVHADYSDLGYVYFLLGDSQKALMNFHQATRSEQDDYFDLSLTHQRWAKCLEKINQLDGSKLQLDKAREVRRKILKTPLEEDQADYFSEDFLYYNTSEKRGFVRILLDYDFWTGHSKRRLSELSSPDEDSASPQTKRYPYDLFVWHANRDIRWTVAFIRKLEWEHKICCCIQQRDFEIGKEVTSDVIQCLKRSYKCVVILSPMFQEETYWKYVINQAILESANKSRSDSDEDYILPIMLKECQTPPVLNTVTAWVCEDGQIPQKRWNELVQKVTQR